MTQKKLAPIHPGEVLWEDFLKPFQLSGEALAESIKLDLDVVQSILEGKAPITANIALRLFRFFGTFPDVWMNLQSQYDLELERDNLEEQLLKDIVPYGII